MFEAGFFGTNAPMYMDIITLYFTLLPFLMGSAIYMAIKKRYKLHKRMQTAIYIATLLIVALFEVGVRFSGGFDFFMKHSSADYTYMIIFLIVHIIIAIVSVVLYSVLIYNALKESNIGVEYLSHKKLGIIVYAGMSVTSIMGALIYYYLFVY